MRAEHDSLFNEIAGRSRLRADQRALFTDQCVEQGTFPCIRRADDDRFDSIAQQFSKVLRR